MTSSSWKRILVLVFMCTCLFSLTGKAETRQEKVLAAGTDGEKLVIYIKNPGGNPQITCQIGTGNCESVTISPISEEELPIKTIFLVDNSLSVLEKYRPMITDILTQLAANRLNGEIYSVGVFAEDLTWLLEDSSDYSQIQQAIQSITYQNQETYLTDVLYELLQSEPDDTLKRIVIISDGVDNKAIGYTKEELYGLLEKAPCPIYTLGCTYNDNNEELKNMFALSRMTQGESWLLDDVSDSGEVVNGIKVLNDAWKVTIVPEVSACDGTTRGVRLSLNEGEQTVQYTLEMQMPFADVTAEAETVLESDPVAPEPVNNSEEITEQEIVPVVRQKRTPHILYIAGIATLGITGVVGIVICLKKRRKDNGFQTAPDTHLSENFNVHKKRETVLVGRDGDESGSKISGRKTYLAWGRQMSLTDLNHPEKVFHTILDGNAVIVGYNKDCQIRLNYEESVSGEHCRILEQNGTVTVQNLSGTNPTLLNGKIVEKEEAIKTGDILTIGRLKMKVFIDLCE